MFIGMQASACIAPLYGLITASRKPHASPHTLGSALGCMGRPCIRWLFSYRLCGKTARQKCQAQPTHLVCHSAPSITAQAAQAVDCVLSEPQHIHMPPHRRLPPHRFRPKTSDGPTVSKLLTIQGFNHGDCLDAYLAVQLGTHHREALAPLRGQLRHVLLRYTPQCQALVVIVMTEVVDVDRSLRHLGSSGLCISNRVLPVALWSKMQPIREGAHEVNLSELLTCDNLDFVEFCEHEVIRARDADDADCEGNACHVGRLLDLAPCGGGP